MSFQRFITYQFQQLSEHSENIRLVLPGETKHDQTGVIIRRVGPYVGKIKIKGHKDPAFFLTSVGQVPIARANESLVADGSSLVSGGSQLLGQIYG